MFTKVIHVYNYTSFILEVENNGNSDYCMDDTTRGYTFVLSDDPDVSKTINNDRYFNNREGVVNEFIYKMLPTKEFLSRLTWHHK